MTDPTHSTDPAWAARLAREQALEEAAEVADDHAAIAAMHEDSEGHAYCRRIARAIRAINKEPTNA